MFISNCFTVVFIIFAVASTTYGTELWPLRNRKNQSGRNGNSSDIKIFSGEE